MRILYIHVRLSGLAIRRHAIVSLHIIFIAHHVFSIASKISVKHPNCLITFIYVQYENRSDFTKFLYNIINKGNNKITELRTI